MSLMTRRMKKPNPRDKSFRNLTCLGSSQMMKPLLNIATPVAKKPIGYCEPTTKMYQRQNSLSKLPQMLPVESHHLNGNESLKEKQSTLIRSSRLSTMFSLMKREQDTWETRKLLLESLNQKSAFQPQQSGLLLGEKPQKLFPLPSDRKSVV